MERSDEFQLPLPMDDDPDVAEIIAMFGGDGPLPLDDLPITPDEEAALGAPISEALGGTPAGDGGEGGPGDSGPSDAPRGATEGPGGLTWEPGEYIDDPDPSGRWSGEWVAQTPAGTYTIQKMYTLRLPFWYFTPSSDSPEGWSGEHDAKTVPDAMRQAGEHWEALRRKRSYDEPLPVPDELGTPVTGIDRTKYGSSHLGSVRSMRRALVNSYIRENAADPFTAFAEIDRISAEHGQGNDHTAQAIKDLAQRASKVMRSYDYSTPDFMRLDAILQQMRRIVGPRSGHAQHWWGTGKPPVTEDRIPGGEADAMDASEFDAGQLAKGKEHEREHTDDADVAREIAMDHLAEDPKYYEEGLEIGLRDIFGE